MTITEIVTLAISIITTIYLGYDRLIKSRSDTSTGQAAMFGNLSVYSQNLFDTYSAQVSGLRQQLAEVTANSEARTEVIRKLEARIDELEREVLELRTVNEQLKSQLEPRRKRGSTGNLTRNVGPK